MVYPSGNELRTCEHRRMTKWSVAAREAELYAFLSLVHEVRGRFTTKRGRHVVEELEPFLFGKATVFTQKSIVV